MAYKFNPRACIICGTGYTPTSNTQKYCRECGPENGRIHLLTPRTCPVCGAPYLPHSSSQKYCPVCAPAAHEDRRKSRCRIPEVRARSAARQRKWRAALDQDRRLARLSKQAEYRSRPENLAKRFLKSFPDCTSAVGEVMEMQQRSLSGIDGSPCNIGPQDYHLDHIHGGPVVGLIPGGLNRHLTPTYLATFDEAGALRWLAPAAVEYIKLRIELADISAGRIAWG